MQRIGVDDSPGAGGKSDPPDAGGADDNELFAGPGSTMKKLVPWWQQPLSKKSGPHTPGLWVLYFSLAALPLFGIGQHWIPATETGRRRYVFVLLLVYVAAALALLVTTSFLNLRRYLRQRRVEMPLSIAGTWVGVGAVLIVVVMLFAALIPRPGAEIALSRVPWQRSSSDDRQASRLTAIQDRGAKGASKSTAGGERAADEDPDKRREQVGDKSNANGKTRDADNDPSAKSEDEDSASASDKAGDQAGGDQAGGDQKGEGDRAAKSDSSQSTEAKQGRPQESSPAKSNAGKSASKTNEPERSTQAPTDPGTQRAQETLQKLSQAVGEISGLMKLVFYAILALLACFAVWNYRDQILQALADILSQLKAMFGGKTARAVLNEANPALLQPPLASFRDFHDPFSTGQHTRMQPDELVRYTFAAFEAWANDHGRPRTPDCTPHEFVSLAVDPESPMYEPARQLVRLYGQMAYASRRISRQSAGELQALWQLMQSTHTEIAPGLSATLHL
jgi:hypothetical protein